MFLTTWSRLQVESNQTQISNSLKGVLILQDGQLVNYNLLILFYKAPICYEVKMQPEIRKEPKFHSNKLLEQKNMLM